MSIGPVNSAAAAPIAPTALDKGGKTYGGMSVWSPSNPGSIGKPVWTPGDQVAASIQQETGGSAEYAQYVLSVASPLNNPTNSSTVALSWEAWQKQKAEQNSNSGQARTTSLASLPTGPTTYEFKKLVGEIETESAGKVASSIDAMKSKLDSAYPTQTRKKNA